ncbi:unnamed protein product [Arctia plantaginis]|uniref:Transposase n=1 Tax=Arctia plantaginis TaxID=874455 RepID=A0A8S1AXZ4_ARCPL|nr:unnamed protein product [Arctia plantaginis]
MHSKKDCRPCIGVHDKEHSIQLIQPVSYTFCCGTTSAIELAQQIHEVIEKLYLIGFKVLTTVCDQSAINKLIQKTKADYLRRNEVFKRKVFEVNGEEVIPLYDPPHLLKGIRNNLMNKNLKCIMKNDVNVAKWEHLEMLLKEDPGFDGLRMLPKLTESHLNPNKLKKMKVKCAAQVLSHSTAIFMGYLARKGILVEDAKETARLLLFFDELFDSVNGSFHNFKKKPGKKFLGPLTPNSTHYAGVVTCSELFDDELTASLDERGLTPERARTVSSSEDLEELVESLTGCIREACRVAIPAMSSGRRRPQASWWAPEIEAKKKTVNRLRSRIRNASSERRQYAVDRYLEAKRAYKEAITRSWREFCGKQEKESVWDGMGDEIKRAVEGPCCPGHYTNSHRIGAAVSGNFLSRDTEETDTSEQRECRAEVAQEFKFINERPLELTNFTAAEADRVGPHRNAKIRLAMFCMKYRLLATDRSAAGGNALADRFAGVFLSAVRCDPPRSV